MKIQSASSFASAVSFWRRLYRQSPLDLSLVIALMIAQTLSAGVGVLLLIPLLSVLGVESGQVTDTPINRWVTEGFALLGIPLSLAVILLVYVVLITLVATLRYATQVRSNRIQQQFIHAQRNELYGFILHSDWGWVSRLSLADLGHALTQQVQQIGRMAQLCFQLISQTVLGVGFLLAALLVSWELSALALLFFCASSLALLPLYRRTLSSGLAQLAGHKQLFQAVTEQLHSLRMIKLFNAESHFAGELSNTSAHLEHQQLRLSRMTAAAQWLLAVSTALLVSGYFYVSLELLQASLPELLVLLVILARLLPLISGVQRTVQQFMHAVPASEDVGRLRHQLLVHQETQAPTGKRLYRLQKSLRLEGVHFAYEGGGPLFNEFSCELNAGEITALVGPSGVGKSTLADIIAGLLVPQKGIVFCDGEPIAIEHVSDWRRSVSYVAQEPLLFNDTIANNLRWVAPQTSEPELMRALDMAAAGEFVRSLPEGLNTVIGDHGRYLSGGQRQRLAIARALLRNPSLLILDEATNALDRENELLIRETLLSLKGKLTVLLISHQASVLEVADRVVGLRGNV